MSNMVYLLTDLPHRRAYGDADKLKKLFYRVGLANSIKSRGGGRNGNDSQHFGCGEGGACCVERWLGFQGRVAQCVREVCCFGQAEDRTVSCVCGEKNRVY